MLGRIVFDELVGLFFPTQERLDANSLPPDSIVTTLTQYLFSILDSHFGKNKIYFNYGNNWVIISSKDINLIQSCRCRFHYGRSMLVPTSVLYL